MLKCPRCSCYLEEWYTYIAGVPFTYWECNVCDYSSSTTSKYSVDKQTKDNSKEEIIYGKVK